jgi:hypothetical protein
MGKKENSEKRRVIEVEILNLKEPWNRFRQPM